MNFSDFFLVKYAPEILQETGTHLLLVGVSIGVATLVGIPLGILITRQAHLRKPILGIANILQTVPSLALFGFLISVQLIGGIGAKTAIIALTLYSLTLIRICCSCGHTILISCILCTSEDISYST